MSAVDEPALDDRDKAALLLAAGQSTDVAGRAVGVDGRTVRRWRAEDSDFRARVDQARQAMFDAALGRAVDAAASMVDALRVIALDEGEESPVRVRAATAVLDQAVKLRQHVELESEFAELRTAVEKITGGRS